MILEVAVAGFILFGAAAVLREAREIHRDRIADEERDVAIEASECTLWVVDIEYAEGYGQWVRAQMKERIRERA